MKCYEITSEIVPGLAITYTQDALPNVLLCSPAGVVSDAAGRLCLSEPLTRALQKISSSGLVAVNRLLCCDFEMTSELWLTEEREPSKKVLVLVTAHNKNGSSPGKLGFLCSGGSTIIAQCDFTRFCIHYPGENNPGFERHGRAALVVLEPGSQVVAQEKFKKVSLLGRAPSWSTEDLSTVSLNEAGQLDLQFHSKRAAYIARIVGGTASSVFREKSP